MDRIWDPTNAKALKEALEFIRNELKSFLDCQQCNYIDFCWVEYENGKPVLRAYREGDDQAAAQARKHEIKKYVYDGLLQSLGRNPPREWNHGR